ncbi:hypothetical protein N7499_005555 [Penicillium canescens]|uniref:tRNA-dihydrouridine(16/17) synthase [NAD(P)(+)] n=1 Tax=Penicillium canescens TaxID=5083 RepID=A0AAD6IC21_PENCN|nr:hypothetical protein N7522_009725 [Penicillium canescens]KAJ6043125.1 hypothetical protein N7460_004480 [Penicillium canescens]KAJ6080681.1 hypothetical protein N7499_005555 [Penicillium canescens]
MVSENPPQHNEQSSAPATQKEKLFGRKFYESIGSPKYVVAPMVDRSEFAWRMLTRSFMPPDEPKPMLAYSPMYHARLFGEQERVRNQNFQPTRQVVGGKKEDLFLDGNPAIDRPLFVQFCSNNPDEFLEAARHVAPYCDAVDLNLGCPQGIARKGHYGAFLQEDWDLIYKLINRLHTELPIPVTVKFRIQEDKEKTLEYAKMILSAGASIITVHGRRREQKGHMTGLADWEYLRYLRDNLPPETVIFANGNILNYDDIEKCLEATGADGVMSAEGNLSDPSIFSKPPPLEAKDENTGGGGMARAATESMLFYDDTSTSSINTFWSSLSQRGSLYNDHNDGPLKKKQKRNKSDKVKKPNSASLGFMQAHLFQVLRPMVATHTDVRDALARSRPGDMAAFEHTLALLEKAIKGGLQEYEASPEKFETKPDENLTGSKATIAEYGRPWWICQPHVRPLPEEAFETGALREKGSKPVPKGEKEQIKESTDANTSTSEGTVTPGDGAAAATAITPDSLVSG